MTRATQAILSTILLAAFAWAAGPQVPPTPATPATPATPQTPATPRVPRTPRAPHGTSYLGIDTCDVTPERASQLHLPKSNGVEVAMVDQDAPAGKAGLKEHDVIVAFNGKPVADSSDLKSFIRDTTPGKTVTLGIVRDGKPMDVKATLASHPEFSTHLPPIPSLPSFHIPSIDVPVMMMLSRHNGLTVEPLNQQLAQAFGATSGHGLLIRSVEQNSAAANAGFRAGDIIVKVGNQPINSLNDWNNATRQSGKVAVTVVRDKREQTLNLTISDKRHQNSSVDLGDMNVDVGDINVQIANIGPEIEKAMADAQKAVQKALNSPEYRQQIQAAQREAQREVQKAMQLNRSEIQKQVEQARREAEKAAKEWQKQGEKWQQEWQHQQQEQSQEQD